MRWAGLAIAVALAAGASARAADLRTDVAAWRAAHEAEILGQLDQLTRIPSVAADPKGLDAAADTLQRLLKARGFETRLLSHDGPGPKVVFGELKTPGARRTVVFYAHYDGQPVTPAQWASDPFALVVRSGTLEAKAPVLDWRAARPPYGPEWRLYGRAVADDKMAMAAFLQAFDALKATGRRPSVNLKVFWEGEEESGSPHLAEVLKANAPLLAANLWLIGDAPVHPSRRPTLYFGARGTLGLEATIYGPLSPLHDGHYGNWVPNPAAMAASLVAAMRDDEGRILIPGLSDEVRAPSAADRAALAALPEVEPALRRGFGIGRTEGADGLTASTLRPALNIRGIRSGQTGAAANNAIPTEAEVSIDFRLVPDQTPDHVRAAVEAFLTSRGWTIVRTAPDLATRLAHPRIIRLSWGEGAYPALRTDVAAPVSRAVIAAAGRAAGAPVVILPTMGASVPLYLFQDALHAPVIGLPIANHDDAQHAPNENLRLQNLWDGVATYAGLMGDLTW